MKMPETKSQYYALVGGLDLESAALSKPAGLVIAAQNYEQSALQGYERVGGFERFDGRSRPSDAGYVVLGQGSAWSGVVVGNTVNGLTSGATGKVIQIRNSTQLVLTRVTGSFTSGETIRVGATAVGAFTQTPGDITGFDDNGLKALAANDYRADIGAVPGSGPIRGVAVLDATVYAWRDNAGGTAGAIHKSTSSGWSAVALGRELAFTAGSGTSPAEGATITKGGVSAVVRRVVLQTGTWAAGTAAGRFIIDAPTGGSFSAGAFTAGVTATCSGAETQITLLPGGRLDYVAYNFTGATNTRRLYGADGVNPGFEFDGTVYVPIRTGMAVDTPVHCTAHQNHLFFSFRGSVQHSGIGSPYQWTVVSGAAELGAGAEVTGFLAAPGEPNTAALLVFTETRTMVLYGTSSADWKFTTFSPNVGAKRWSGQNLGMPVVLDALGVAVLQQSQAFGNFDRLPVSARIQRLVSGALVSCSVVSRSTNRMRAFFSDGTGLSITPLAEGLAFMPLAYDRAPRVACEAVINGVTRTFFGSDDGFIYEADVGRSFDGRVITAWLKLAFDHSRSPVARKRFRRVDLEVKPSSACELQVQAEFDLGDPDVGLTAIQSLQVSGAGLSWDSANWDTSFWDAPAHQSRKVRLDGVGSSMSLLVYGSSADQLPHVLQSVTTLFTPRRGTR